MNEKREKLDYYFTPVPTVLLRATDLLNKNDRDLLYQIASFYPDTLYYSVNRLTEDILVCGELAFYRSLYKLVHLKIIELQSGHKRRPNHYRFVADPQKWRVTKNMQEILARHAKKISGKDLVFEHEAFPNIYGFLVSFNICYPKYAIELPKAQKKIEDPVRPPIEQDYRTWQNRTEQMAKNNTSIYVLKNYNYLEAHVSAYKAWKDGILADYLAGEIEKKYIKELIEKYEMVAKNPKSEFEKKCFSIMKKLSNEGKNGFEIDAELRKLEADYKRSLQTPASDPE